MDELLVRFNRIYKGCELYAIHLDGFSHSVFYKDEEGEKHIDQYSQYNIEYIEKTHKVFSRNNDYAFMSWNENNTKELFSGYSHYCYKHNAKEYIYKDVKEWNN